MISTAPSFLGKPYLPGCIFDYNTHFPTFSMTVNYSKSGGGQQIGNPSGSVYCSLGARKPEVHGESILLALAFTEPVTLIQILFILIRTSDVMTQSNTYGRIIKHLG